MFEKEYLLIKKIKANPITRGAYCESRGWLLPKDENPADKGYTIMDESGHITWLPEDVFDRDCIRVYDGE